MNNKETLQSYNNRLSENNITLENIIDTIDTLPEAKEIVLQDKEITPTKETQVINYDEEYDGLNQVTVNPIPNEYIIPSGVLEITENGEKDVANYSSVNVNVASSGGEEKISPKTISFAYSTATTLGGFEHLDTSNITNMQNMFKDCTNLTSLNLSNFNTSNVTTMYDMFYNASNLTSLNVDGWDINKVTNMGEMFSNCLQLTELNLSSFVGSRVTSTGYMFNSCTRLLRLDLSNFVGTNVTDTSYMFNTCTRLMYLDIRNFDFSKVTSYSSMFNRVPSSCEIIVKDDTAKAWVLARGSNFTNVKTVAEL